ncbi:MAG: NUDIX hydrolase [Bacilli bacterium]|nr:NUDIX hydrolase [Bacilli bacterium]
MKEILYNYDKLEAKDINKVVRRAKVLIMNPKDEFLVVLSHHNYFLIGGRVEDNETYDECLVREVKEEAGITLPMEEREPFLVIRHLCKSYPTENDNTEYIAKYFCIKADIVPDMSQIELTDDEKDGNFHLEYIHKDEVIKKLEDSLETCTRDMPVKDTIQVIKEYLNMNK